MRISHLQGDGGASALQHTDAEFVSFGPMLSKKSIFRLAFRFWVVLIQLR
jgi:hypothetical protein